MSAGEPHLLRLPPVATTREAADHLAAALSEPRARRGQALSEASLLRVEQPLSEAPDLLDWLAGFPALPRAYWADRKGTFRLAAAGIADESEGPDFRVIDAMLERVAVGAAADSLRLIGSARFDLGRPPDRDWSAFRRVHAYLPLLELRRSDTEDVLAVNLKAGPGLQSGGFDAQRRIARKALLEGAANLTPAIKASPDSERPEDDPDAWSERIQTLLDHIAAGELEKAVLARCATHAVDWDPLTLLRRLIQLQPHAFHFFLQPTPTAAFLGASPERLYRRRGDALETEALAGTRRRGATPEDDATLERALLASRKDAREHEVVRQYILSRLAPLSEKVQSASERSVRRLAHVIHLQTPVTAQLKEGIRDAALLAALHPTPAVCGMPPLAGMSFIRGKRAVRPRALLRPGRLLRTRRGRLRCGHSQRSRPAGRRTALRRGRHRGRIECGGGVVRGDGQDARACSGRGLRPRAVDPWDNDCCSRPESQRFAGRHSGRLTPSQCVAQLCSKGANPCEFWSSRTIP